ncbi:RNA polymerase sigma-70 factor [Membranicola marinus]|uniref:RNA polymerase sigma-70 factor n=1 Tax=Membranihabitans marinus TaxID=1227546 RepID=A0A953HQG9_9BACT|nr:RNA polymerase sigma-70 factor [Membranihabitans marinus]MBY5959374.1 RNA polymerase sigma-70 factor [Membranihabitans marinus]
MNKIYESYRDFIYQFFLKHVKVPALAEDLTQDVFVKFWQKKDTFENIDNLDAWLYTLARNHLTDHYRKLATEKKYQETVWYHMERQSNSVLLDIYKEELENEIEELLNSLSPRQKEVYILSRKNGLSLEEIAVKLKISPNTAKNHLVQALKVVRQGLENHYTCFFVLLMIFLGLG